MHRLLSLLPLLLFGHLSMLSQAGLDCNGSIYRIIEHNYNETILQKIFINPENKALHIEELTRYNGHQLNGICFHPNSSSIYGIKLGDPYRLFKIDQGLELSILKELPLPPSLFFVAADIMPDGRHMVVLGFGTEEDRNVVAIIDLEDPNFKTEVFPLKQNESEISVVCADIAFHPTTGLLYGFDQRSNRMIQIDLDERSIHFFDQEVYSEGIGVVPSLFFDMNANLFGFTIGVDGDNSRKLFQFDKVDGSAKPIAQVAETGSQDACSCPYQVQMYQTINNVSQYKCTEARFTIRLVNRTPIMQTGLSLVDTLPEGFKIKSIDYNPFEHVSPLDAENNILNISDFSLPIGEDSIVYTVSISPKARLGYHVNQAWITKENPDTRSNLREPLRSDDPRTIVHQDPTGFILDELFDGAEIQNLTLCQGSELNLDANVLGAQSYTWNTGEDTQGLTIDRPGLYIVDLETACGSGSMEFNVVGSYIDVTLGEDHLVDPNEPVVLIPDISTGSQLESIIWKNIGGVGVLDCYTCIFPTASAPRDMQLEVSVQNIDGCEATDDVFVGIDEIRHYFANGFSPNGDGVNDVFFLQSKRDYNFKEFRVFDRWGNSLFEAAEGVMNDKAYGWDGSGNGEVIRSGVFVWSAKIIGFDNSVSEVHGDITLVR